jgi:hypothetical protein
MASDDPFLFCQLGCLPFFSLWPLMNPFSFVHWVRRKDNQREKKKGVIRGHKEKKDRQPN